MIEPPLESQREAPRRPPAWSSRGRPGIRGCKGRRMTAHEPARSRVVLARHGWPASLEPPSATNSVHLVEVLRVRRETGRRRPPGGQVRAGAWSRVREGGRGTCEDRWGLRRGVRYESARTPARSSRTRVLEPSQTVRGFNLGQASARGVRQCTRDGHAAVLSSSPGSRHASRPRSSWLAATVELPGRAVTEPRR